MRARALIADAALAGIIGLATVGATSCKGSDPEEMARERGAIELLRAWPCAAGGDLGAVAGGDLKTDWSASRQPDGSYLVRRTAAAATDGDAWSVRVAEHAVTPVTDGAKAAWRTCVTTSSPHP